jgi:hypothetical protein
MGAVTTPVTKGLPWRCRGFAVVSSPPTGLIDPARFDLHHLQASCLNIRTRTIAS